MRYQISRRGKFFPIIVAPFFWLLLAGGAILPAGCSNTDESSPVDPEPEIAQRYLFDVYYVNAAWGYRLTGVYIDNQGLVVSYDHSHERWTAEDYNNLTEAELDEKYIAPQDTIGTIDQATLREKFELIETARLGELSERVLTGFDMGGKSYVCYVYDDEEEKYGLVLLDLSGDFTQSNLSPEAVALTSWLRSVLEAAVQ